MNKLKRALKWIKEKWWVSLSGIAIVVAAVLFSKKNGSLTVVTKNRELDNNIKELEKEALKKEEQERKKVLERVGIKVAELDLQKEKKELEMLKNKKKRVKDLSSKTNEELAEMLKKENEI